MRAALCEPRLELFDVGQEVLDDLDRLTRRQAPVQHHMVEDFFAAQGLAPRVDAEFGQLQRIECVASIEREARRALRAQHVELGGELDEVRQGRLAGHVGERRVARQCGMVDRRLRLQGVGLALEVVEKTHGA